MFVESSISNFVLPYIKNDALRGATMAYFKVGKYECGYYFYSSIYLLDSLR